MFVYGVKCEICETCENVLPPIARHNTTIPKGWLLVFKDEMQNSEGWHFCSPQCLEIWAQTEREKAMKR